MDVIVDWVFRALRPRIGWVPVALALMAAACVPLAASASTLELSSEPFIWAMLGVPLGLWLAPARAAASTGTRPLLRAALRALLVLLLVGLGGLLILLPIDKALPPLNLLLQDIGGWAGWLGRTWQASTLSNPFPSVEQPIIRTWSFLGESLPRFWNNLSTAPDRGRDGARVMVMIGGATLTWLSAWTLGWGLQRGRAFLFWELPLLLTLTLLTMFGGGGGLSLMFGLTLLLILLAHRSYSRRAAAWEAQGTDYSGELNADVMVWGGLLVIPALLLAVIVPAWLGNPFAQGVWSNVEPPSGIAELDRNVGPRPDPPSRVGLSSLPALGLGISLEQGPPEQLALRISVSKPLAEAPYPQYWRARVFNIYNGRGWTTDARVSAQDPIQLTPDPFPNAVLQTVEDLRPDRRVLVALPDPVALDVPTNAERLTDGALTALTADGELSRYQVLSSPPAAATSLPPDLEPPDFGPYLGLPAMPSRVGETARALVGSATSDNDRALALETYLRSLPYSYQVAPLPAQGDAVDQFLFEMGQGYCTYYASAMAVMARSLGIPARVASGYATGEFDPATNTYTIAENSAHAWPELYIGGRWEAFEPTPIRPLPARTGGEQPQAPVVTAPAPQPVAPSWRGPLIWLAVLLGIGLVSLLGWRLGRRPEPLPLPLQIQSHLERLGLRLGVPWPRGATLHEYGGLVAPKVGAAGGALLAALRLVERARYAGTSLTAEEERRLLDEWQRVREATERGGDRR